MYIVAGVSCSGKSTFIESEQRISLGLPRKPQVLFAYQGKRALWCVSHDAVLHYNILRFLQHMQGNLPPPCSFYEYYHFKADPMFRQIQQQVSRGKIKKCFLIVPFKDDLLSRVNARRFVEENVTEAEYDSTFWRRQLEATDLSRVYETFALEMESLGLMPIVLASRSLPAGPKFVRMSRYNIRQQIEQGNGHELTNKAIERLTSIQEFEYQQINVGNAFSTRGQIRQRSILEALSVPISGKTILDVGAANGALAFSAEQMGASKVIGIEPKRERFRCALALKEELNSHCEFLQVTLLNLPIGQSFDHVFILNVLHHVDKFNEVIEMLLKITRESLTIEFPCLSDKKFKKTCKFSNVIAQSDLPLIGVSTETQDQTFVYSPEALRRLFMRRGSPFKSYVLWKSPMKDRYMMRFYVSPDEGCNGTVKKANIKDPERPERNAGVQQLIKEKCQDSPLIHNLANKLRLTGQTKRNLKF